MGFFRISEIKRLTEMVGCFRLQNVMENFFPPAITYIVTGK